MPLSSWTSSRPVLVVSSASDLALGISSVSITTFHHHWFWFLTLRAINIWGNFIISSNRYLLDELLNLRSLILFSRPSFLWFFICFFIAQFGQIYLWSFNKSIDKPSLAYLLASDYYNLKLFAFKSIILLFDWISYWFFRFTWMMSFSFVVLAHILIFLYNLY